MFPYRRPSIIPYALVALATPGWLHAANRWDAGGARFEGPNHLLVVDVQAAGGGSSVTLRLDQAEFRLVYKVNGFELSRPSGQGEPATWIDWSDATWNLR